MKKLLVVLLLVLAFGFYYLNSLPDSLGSNGKLSSKSKDQLTNQVLASPKVIGVYVVKTKFTKDQSPIIWISSDNPEFWKLVLSYFASGAGKGIGSEYFAGRNRDEFYITAAVLRGQVVCAPVENTALNKLIGGVDKFVHSVCYLPIPNTPEFSQIIVVLYSVNMEELDQTILINELTKVQMDILNREYMSKETWKELMH